MEESAMTSEETMNRNIRRGLPPYFACNHCAKKFNKAIKFVLVNEAEMYNLDRRAVLTSKKQMKLFQKKK